MVRSTIIQVIHNVGIGKGKGCLNPLSQPLEEGLGFIQNFTIEDRNFSQMDSLPPHINGLVFRIPHHKWQMLLIVGNSGAVLIQGLDSVKWTGDTSS